MKIVAAPGSMGFVLCGLVIAAAVLLRFIGVTARWFWVDELVTANWSAHGPWAALVNALRFDVHPPLYYLQLSLWALFADGDAWLAANSILWSVAAVALLIHAASRIYDPLTGLFAGLLLALAPAALAYSDQLRMYSFLSFLIVWVWYAQERWLNGTAGRFGAIWMIVSEVAVIYSHSGGLVMLSGCVLQGAVRVLAARRRPLVLRWLGIQLIVGTLAVPAIVIAMMRGTPHTRAPDLGAVIETWTFLTTGNPDAAIWAIGVGMVISVGLFALAASAPRARLPLATLVVGPLVIAAGLSYAFKPMWLSRVFVPLVPFICLFVGSAAAARADADRLPARARVIGFTLLALAWAGAGTFQQITRQKGDGYKPAADLVREIQRPGDLVVVDGDYSYQAVDKLRSDDGAGVILSR